MPGLNLVSGLNNTKTNSNTDPETAKHLEKQERKIKFEKRKELQKKLKIINNNIEYNKALEQKLLKEYEDDNYKYIKERDMEMKKVKILIYEEEMRQIEIEEDIEELRNQGT